MSHALNWRDDRVDDRPRGPSVNGGFYGDKFRKSRVWVMGGPPVTSNEVGDAHPLTRNNHST